MNTLDAYLELTDAIDGLSLNHVIRIVMRGLLSTAGVMTILAPALLIGALFIVDPCVSVSLLLLGMLLVVRAPGPAMREIVRQAQLFRAEHCVQCGYSLRHFSGVICPECGGVIVARRRSAESGSAADANTPATSREDRDAAAP